MNQQPNSSESARASVLGNWRAALDVTATIGIIAVCATMLWIMITDRRQPSPPPPAVAPPNAAAATRPAAPLPKEPMSLEGTYRLGRADAQVAVIEFSDFQCPYCGAFARETLPAIEEQYVKTGKIVLAFRHLPLEQIHSFALKASEAAACAGAQGKFWDMHNRLFQNQKELDEPHLHLAAESIGLDREKFSACLQGAMTNQVKQDAQAASALAVSGTPTFFIGRVQPDGRVKVTQRLSGAQPVAQFQSVLDKVLATN